MADAIYATWRVARYEEKEKIAGLDPSILRRVERDIMLQIVDAQWKDHLYSLDHLKEGIGLRGYGQRDPLVEYKKESFTLFQAMKDAHRRGDGPVPVAAASGRPGASDAPPPASGRPPPRRPPPITLSGGSSTTSPDAAPRRRCLRRRRRARRAPAATTRR